MNLTQRLSSASLGTQACWRLLGSDRLATMLGLHMTNSSNSTGYCCQKDFSGILLGIIILNSAN